MAEVAERHRHRYEVNPEKIEALEAAGLHLVGRDETGTRMEIIELDTADHPFFMGTQYHPEFQSRPLNPAPPFYGLVLAAIGEEIQLARSSGSGLTPRPSRSPSKRSFQDDDDGDDSAHFPLKRPSLGVSNLS